jgi:predicted RNase H-like nuclease (RuvC/YqgF family)
MTEETGALMHHIAILRSDVNEIKTIMRELANAVTRLALVEERQAATSTALDSMAHAIEKLDERLRTIETREPLQERVSEWVLNILWAGAAAAAMFIAGKAGLF